MFCIYDYVHSLAEFGEMLLAGKLFLGRKSEKPRSRGKQNVAQLASLYNVQLLAALQVGALSGGSRTGEG